MENLPFVIWMLGYPLVWSIGEYLKKERSVSPGAKGLAALSSLVIWIYFGMKLYVKP